MRRTTKTSTMTPAELARALEYDTQQEHAQAIKENQARDWAAAAGLDYDALMAAPLTQKDTA